MTPESIVTIARAGTVFVNRVRGSAGRMAAGSWASLGNLDDEASARFVTDIVPRVQAAQGTAAAATASYLGRILDTDPVYNPAAALASRGVDPATVYARVAVEARTAVARGHDWTTAMRFASRRAVTLAETDVQLAARHTASQVLEAAGSRVVGYRRIPDTGACELCLISATQRYHVRQLMPIHDHCGCGVAPIIGTTDPGRIIDHDALAQLKASGAIDRASEARRRARARVAAGEAPASDVVTVHEHGELGPVLTQTGHQFTNPAARLLDSLAAAGVR